MPKVTVTLEFSDMSEARVWLATQSSVTSPTPIISQAQTQVPTEAQTQAPALPTLAEIQQALSDFIKKGEGRTASVAKSIMAEFGVTTIKECPDDKKAALLHAFQTR